MITLHIQGKYWVLKDSNKVVYRSKDKNKVIDRYHELIKDTAIKKEAANRSMARIWRF